MAKTPTLTKQQARRAIIIDFEGNMNRAPSLLGWRVGRTNHQVLLEQALAPVVPSDSIEALELDHALRRVKDAAGENYVLGYSEHDLTIIRTYSFDAQLIAWFDERYVNAKSLIDRWINRRAHAGEIQRPDDLTLKSSMNLIGLSYPVAAGPDTVGTTLRRLRDYATKGRSHADLPPGIRRRWHRLLAHNATDLEATQALVVEAVGGDARPRPQVQSTVNSKPQTPDPFAIPDWLMDAWMSGQNYVSRSDGELFAEIARREKSQMKVKLAGEVSQEPEAYWDWWFYASLLAIAGKRYSSTELKESDPEYRELADAVQAQTRRRFEEHRALRRMRTTSSADQKLL